MTFTPDDVLRIVLAVAAGGLIGAEREYREKAAGFRTHILITLGSALFTLYSIKIGGPGNPDRIAANIVTGIGFLGAGSIIHGEFGVSGLTTAATIWLTAAVGMGFGGGYYAESAAALALILAVLLLFPHIEGAIDRRRSARTYEVVIGLDFQKMTEIEGVFKRCGLHLSNHRHEKAEDSITIVYSVYGPPEKHKLLVENLLEDPEVKCFRY